MGSLVRLPHPEKHLLDLSLIDRGRSGHQVVPVRRWIARSQTLLEDPVGVACRCRCFEPPPAGLEVSGRFRALTEDAWTEDCCREALQTAL